jgi:glycosyltransferase involved in cell wall biosynthesis
VKATALVDIAGAQMGGAARYAAELRSYLKRSTRPDVQVLGGSRNVGPGWLLQRESPRYRAARRVAANNVSFVGPGSERWVLLRNALHFVTPGEAERLDPALRASVQREAAVVRLAARRADVLIVPSTAMAERVTRALPWAAERVTVRPHPVSATPGVPPPDVAAPDDPAIFCPVLFAPYKDMAGRLGELLTALSDYGDDSVRIRVTASPADLPPTLAGDARLEFLGRVEASDLWREWARCRACYFPTGLESFGYPLAEARALGRPVIARDTAQNREIAGAALCGFDPADVGSLGQAVKMALTAEVAPDPAPFDPDCYFDWLLGNPA